VCILGSIVIVLFDEKMKLAKTRRSTTNTNNTAVVAATTITTTSSISSPISQTEEPVKIKHSYPIGNSRSVYINEDNDVSIVDDRDNGKHAFFHCTTMGSICSGDSQH